MKFMRTLFSAVLAVALASPLAAQDKPRDQTGIPKKGDPVTLKGCLRGGALEATDVGARGLLDTAPQRLDLPSHWQEGPAERDEAEAR